MGIDRFVDRSIGLTRLPFPIAPRTSGAGAKEREEPRNLKDAYVRLAADLGSGKPLHKVLSALILEQLYEPIKEALQERRAELEAEGRKVEEQRKVGTDSLVEGGGCAGASVGCIGWVCK